MLMFVIRPFLARYSVVNNYYNGCNNDISVTKADKVFAANVTQVNRRQETNDDADIDNISET